MKKYEQANYVQFWKRDARTVKVPKSELIGLYMIGSSTMRLCFAVFTGEKVCVQWSRQTVLFVSLVVIATFVFIAIASLMDIIFFFF